MGFQWFPHSGDSGEWAMDNFIGTSDHICLMSRFQHGQVGVSSSSQPQKPRREIREQREAARRSSPERAGTLRSGFPSLTSIP